ncbi:MAG: LysM peptidoglycan-binding domain-containing protein [Chloroflexota bacterium]
MQEAQIKRQPAAEMVVCPYLGVREDRETSFAFPSMWNCCHLSRSLSPVALEIQRSQCLSEGHSRCPVFERGEKARLPSGYRLKHPPEKGSRRFRAFFLVFVLLLGAGAAWMAFSGEDVSSTVAGLWSGMRTAVPALGGLASSTPGFTPAAATESAVTTPALIVIQPSDTPYPSQTASPASTNVSTLAVTTCGYALDAPINAGKYQFVIHKVSEGESMDLLESRFGTTTNAIQTANYFLPVPLWVDMVIVVPVGSADLSSLPAFEPYYVTGASASLEALARNLSVTADALREYNGWTSECQVFSGWMLVPRERTSP